jgi:hypothetical protein
VLTLRSGAWEFRSGAAATSKRIDTLSTDWPQSNVIYQLTL